MSPTFLYDDGGRAAAGYSGTTGDCVVRSVAIATGKPYQEVYDEINAIGKTERRSKNKTRKSSARTGVYKPTIRKYMESIGAIDVRRSLPSYSSPCQVTCNV